MSDSGNDKRKRKDDNLPAPLPGRARKPLRPWKVILQDDPSRELTEVTDAIVLIAALHQDEAAQRADRARQDGAALLLTTHRERAELYVHQFARQSVTVMIEAE